MGIHQKDPLFACPKCFAHPWLKDYILEENFDPGSCPSCRCRRQPLIPVSYLYGPFRNLLSYYQVAEGRPMDRGDCIIDLIQGHWEVFSDSLYESGRAGKLLEAIMLTGWDDDDGEPPLGASDEYVACQDHWRHDSLENIWEQYCRDVKNEPTLPLQFRDKFFDEFLIHEELLGNRTEQIPAGSVFYRARLGYVKGPDGECPYQGEAIGAPPPERAGPGRVNPKGRVVLYCTDQKITAVSEVRPARGEYVSVAEIVGIKELRILDLRKEPDWPNPFTDESLGYQVEMARLLGAFADHLSMPLRSRDDPTDYIPTQKLAELIETAKVDGIRYPSAMAPKGDNIVFFDPAVIQIGDSRLVEILETSLEYQEYRKLGNYFR